MSGGKGILLLETRDSKQKRVSFSALECESGKFLWRDIVFDEPWWVNLGAVSGDIVLFTVYLETNNPDRKGIFAYHIFDRGILWWNNDFSLISVKGNKVEGVASKYGFRNVILDLNSGTEVSPQMDQPENNDEVIRPHQYFSEHEYFTTVKTFLEEKFNLLPVIALEYMEHDSIIFVSFYIQDGELANYLILISADGKLLLNEKLDEHLKGIGMGTFFVFSGCVFFVKNKGELASYRIV